MEVQRRDLGSAIAAAYRPADDPEIWLTALLRELAPTMGKPLGVVGHYFQLGHSQDVAVRTLQSASCSDVVFEEVMRATAQSPAVLIDQVFNMYPTATCDFASRTFRAVQTDLPTRPRRPLAPPLEDMPPVRDAFGLFIPPSAGVGLFLSAPLCRPLPASPRPSFFRLWREFAMQVRAAYALQRARWATESGQASELIALAKASEEATSLWQRLITGDVALIDFEPVRNGVRIRLALRPQGLSPDFRALTLIEQGVAELAAQGCSNQSIGAQLAIRPGSVNTHLQRILTKLGLARRSHLSSLYVALKDHNAAVHSTLAD